MKTYFHRICLSILLLFTINVTPSFSQFTYGGIDTVIVEVEQVLYGIYMSSCGPIDLTGYVVYNVSLVLSDPNDCVVGIWGGIQEDPDTCNVADDNNLTITFEGEYFNDPFGSSYGNAVPCFLCPTYPAICLDSWVTLDDECNGNSPFPINCANDLTPSTVFSADCATMIDTTDVFIDNGGWFQIFTDGVTDDANYLIAQITTNDTFCIEGQISLQNDCMTGTENIMFEDFSFCQDQPCVASTMDTTPAITPAACFGNDNIVTFDDGGNGPVDYTIYDAGTDVVVTTINDSDPGLSISTLDPGTYYASLIDSIGCRDTTLLFTLTEPPLLEFSASIAQDILCFGDAIGSISTSCIGGTPPVNVLYTGPMNGTVACGTTITGLTTGTYTLVAIDDNSCPDTLVFTFANPAQLNININTTDLACEGYGNGSLVGNISGGTGVINATWTADANANFSGPSVLDVSLNNLSGGNYSLDATDANGCPVSGDFVVFEPEGLEAEITFTDATCFGFCDGEIVVDVSGGTGTPDVDITGGSFNNLCANDYIITITDELTCNLIDTVTITSSTEIIYEFTFTDISCNGDCNGVIDVQNISGGCGNFQYAISPAAGTVNETANSVTYTDLCPGNYNIEITDSCGCGVTISDVILIEPADLIVQTIVEQIECFGDANGSIGVNSNSSGIVTMTEPEIQTLPFTLDNLPPATYQIVINENGCQDSTDVIITEPAELISAIISTTPVGCGGDCDASISAEYSGGTSPYSFELVNAADLTVTASGALNASGSDVIDDVCAGDWLLVMLDAAQCSADSMAIIIDEPDPIVINVTEDWITCTGMCDGSAIVLFSGGTGELTAQFFPEELDPNCGIGSCTLTELCAGVYSVSVTDEANCEQDTTILIAAEIDTDMILTMFSSPETCWNEMDGTATVAVTNGAPPITYQWNDALDQTTATAVALGSNEVYTVIVTDAIGCTLSGQVEVETSLGCFFISTALTPNGDGVNDDWLIGGLEYFPEVTVQVFNRWAQLLYESHGYDAPWDGTYKGRQLPVADYYFVINYSEEADPILGTVTIKY